MAECSNGYSDGMVQASCSYGFVQTIKCAVVGRSARLRAYIVGVQLLMDDGVGMVWEFRQLMLSGFGLVKVHMIRTYSLVEL